MPGDYWLGSNGELIFIGSVAVAAGDRLTRLGQRIERRFQCPIVWNMNQALKEPHRIQAHPHYRFAREQTHMPCPECFKMFGLEEKQVAFLLGGIKEAKAQPDSPSVWAQIVALKDFFAYHVKRGNRVRIKREVGPWAVVDFGGEDPWVTVRTPRG